MRPSEGIRRGGGVISLEESRNRRQREQVAIQNCMQTLSELVGIGVDQDGSVEEQVMEINSRSLIIEYLSHFYELENFSSL